ncbi:hypothetical protein [Solimonas soli]|uniref:hypothetical protein n=1 Tax=Solimonas soli TaxID=413479 RepID=UPI0012FC504D|nr:hypothetical protein [Solimonas soli]
MAPLHGDPLDADGSQALPAMPQSHESVSSRSSVNAPDSPIPDFASYYAMQNDNLKPAGAIHRRGSGRRAAPRAGIALAVRHARRPHRPSQ